MSARVAVTALALLTALPLLAQAPDLATSKSGTATASPGTDVTYSITVQNVGTADAATATLSDPLPGGMTFVSVTPAAGFSCSDPGVGNNGTVTCTAASMVQGATATFTLVAHIPPATPLGTYLTNTATASTAGDNNPENDSASWATLVPGPSADLSALKTGPASAPPNSDVAYTITIQNNGSDAAQNVTFTDTLPAGSPSSPMTFVSFTQNSGPAFNCGVPAATTTCTIASLSAGAVATFSFVGHIPNGTATGTTYTNTVTVSSGTPDPTPENNTGVSSLEVASTDVGITKSAPATATAGTTFDYVITMSNAGPDAATNVTWVDNLPAGTTFVALVQNTGPAASCTSPAVGSGGLVACTVPLLGNGASAQFTLTVGASSGVANGTVISNTATVTSDTFDPNANNNSSTASTTISASADVAVTKTGPASAPAGTNVTYAITLTNNGPSNAASVSLADAIPAGTTFVSEVQNSGPAFSCAAGTCTIASFAAGASAQFTLTLAISGATLAGTVITNTVTASAATADPALGNNSSSASTTTTAAAVDIAVTKTAGPGPYFPGSPVQYTITVTNTTAGAPANGVVVTDVIPAGTTFVSATPTQGSCSGTTTVTCNLGTLNGGASATIALTLTLPLTAGTVVSNTASATTTSPDSNPANNSSTASVTVALPAAIPTLPPMALALMALALAAAGWLVRRLA